MTYRVNLFTFYVFLFISFMTYKAIEDISSGDGHKRLFCAAKSYYAAERPLTLRTQYGHCSP